MAVNRQNFWGVRPGYQRPISAPQVISTRKNLGTNSVKSSNQVGKETWSQKERSGKFCKFSQQNKCCKDFQIDRIDVKGENCQICKWRCFIFCRDGFYYRYFHPQSVCCCNKVCRRGQSGRKAVASWIYVLLKNLIYVLKNIRETLFFLLQLSESQCMMVTLFYCGVKQKSALQLKLLKDACKKNNV